MQASVTNPVIETKQGLVVGIRVVNDAGLGVVGTLNVVIS